MPADRPIRVHALIDSLGIGGAEMVLAEFAAVAPLGDIELSVGYLKDVGEGDRTAMRLRAAGVEPRPGAMDPAHLRVGIYRDPAIQATARLNVDGITVARTRKAAESNAYRSR